MNESKRHTLFINWEVPRLVSNTPAQLTTALSVGVRAGGQKSLHGHVIWVGPVFGMTVPTSCMPIMNVIILSSLDMATMLYNKPKVFMKTMIDYSSRTVRHSVTIMYQRYNTTFVLGDQSIPTVHKSES